LVFMIQGWNVFHPPGLKRRGSHVCRNIQMAWILGYQYLSTVVTYTHSTDSLYASGSG
jgi:hypothetical protein